MVCFFSFFEAYYKTVCTVGGKSMWY